MVIERFFGLLDLIHLFFQKKAKVNDYTQYQLGSNYMFEATDGGRKGYMTGYGKGIKPNEYIALQNGAKVEYFRIETVEYYSNPSDMWIAFLSKVNSHP